MSILFFAGFDVFAGQADAGNTLPVHGAGITGTPYATQLPIVRSATTQLMGVSGLAQHKLGAGAKLRNGLVAYRPGGANTYIQAALIRGDILGQGAWSRVIQFTAKDVSAADPSGPMALLCLGTTNIALNSFLLGLNSNRTLMVNGSGVAGFTWERNREYSMEMRLWRLGNEATNVINFELRVDGIVLRTGNAPIVGLTTPMWVSLGLNTNTTVSENRTMVYGDIVVSDGDYIGPHVVLPVTVNSLASAGGWEKEGNADAVTTLNDRDDATFFTSPTDAGALSTKLAVAEDPNVSVKAAQLFVRSKRDADAGRGLQVRMENASGSTIGGPVVISNTTSFGDYKLFDLAGGSVDALTKSTLKISAVTP